MNKLGIVLVAFMVAFSAAGCKESASPSPQETSDVSQKEFKEVAEANKLWIRDNAKVLTERQKHELSTKLLRFQNATSDKPQIVVATVKSLGENNIEDFTIDLFKKIGVGNKKYDNGILIVIATDDRKLRIEVGYGFEGTVPDMVAKQIIREKMVPNLKKGSENWYKAIDMAVDELISKAKI